MNRRVGWAALVLAAALAGCGGGGTTSATSTSPVTTVPAPATPNYKTVAKTTKIRFDHKPSYYIVIDPVDVSTDAFKQNVRLVFQAVARTNGDPNFSADVFDDEPTARTQFSYDTNASSPTNSELKAQAAQMQQHDVAMYDGGLNIGGQQYNIGWYPAASDSTPNVGRYAGWEQWKP